jgi:hypothetical protein
MLLGRFYKRPSHNLSNADPRILTCETVAENSGTKNMSEKTNNAPKTLTAEDRLSLLKANLKTSAIAADKAESVVARSEKQFTEIEAAYKAELNSIRGVRKETGQIGRTFSANVRKAYKAAKDGKETKKVFRAIVEAAAKSQLGTFDNVWSEQVKKDKAVETGEAGTDASETRGQSNELIQETEKRVFAHLAANDCQAAAREIGSLSYTVIVTLWNMDKDGKGLPETAKADPTCREYNAMQGRTFAALAVVNRAVGVWTKKVSDKAFAIANAAEKANLTDAEKAEIAANAATDAEIAKESKSKGRSRKAATLKDGALV